jgi:hypothetical protein
MLMQLKDISPEERKIFGVRRVMPSAEGGRNARNRDQPPSGS